MPARLDTRPRKRAVQARSQATVDAILEATAHILVTEGYDRASTNKVAARAGVSIGSLYQYFPGKEALVAALLDRHVDRMGDVLRAAFPRLAGAPVERAAVEVVRLMVAAHSVDPALHKVFVEQVPRIGKLERVQDVEREMTGLVRAYLETRRDRLVVRDLDLAAYIVVGIVESLTHAAVLSRPDLLGEPFVEEVSAVVVRYLTGGGRERRRPR
ncbi:MAG TPA: TetR/AcrR family transcriptional regulator [Kofleriaceae bacterium]|nr:TetR/AcrR family transcriptional regulator [Kofleriaceae bacterium]